MERAQLFGGAVSGERPRKLASFLTARIYSRCVSGTNLRMFMSSSMRWRSGLMGFSLIGGSCLEVGVLEHSILKTERPPVTRARSNSYCGRRNRPTAPPAPPARAGSFFGTFRTCRDVRLESVMRTRADIDIPPPRHLFVYKTITPSDALPAK